MIFTFSTVPHLAAGLLLCIHAFSCVAFFLGKTLLHYQNPYKIAINAPITLKIGLKLAIIVFFKNQ